jgi:cysteine-rich repeat protein
MVAVANYTGGVISFWSGSYVVSVNALVTDDIIAHEWTHAVIQYASGSFYGSGGGDAMNESYPDIFGETIDLLNGRGDDSAAVRWALFEDALGARGFRHMMNPAAALTPGPAKMSEVDLLCGAATSHQRGGITNHAYALMVDGGLFNRFAITGIGLTKAAKIEYRALTLYLTESSSFRDNYAALLQSCDDLIGVDGMTEADCREVKKSLDAVEMDFPWPCSCGDDFQTSYEGCDDGNTTDGDGCDSNCTTTACGNRVVTSSEQCDGGSCCTAECEFIPAGTPCAEQGVFNTDYQCDGAGDCMEIGANTPSPSPSPSPTTCPTPTPTAVATDTPSQTPSPSLTATSTATPTTVPCAGSCDADPRVTVSELVTAVRIALGMLPVSVCSTLDGDQDGAIAIDELTIAVGNSLHGCR